MKLVAIAVKEESGTLTGLNCCGSHQSSRYLVACPFLSWTLETSVVMMATVSPDRRVPTSLRVDSQKIRPAEPDPPL